MAITINGTDLDQEADGKWWGFTVDWPTVTGWCAPAHRAELVEAVMGATPTEHLLDGSGAFMGDRAFEFAGTPSPLEGIPPGETAAQTIDLDYHYRVLHGTELFAASVCSAFWGWDADGEDCFKFRFCGIPHLIGWTKAPELLNGYVDLIEASPAGFDDYVRTAAYPYTAGAYATAYEALLDGDDDTLVSGSGTTNQTQYRVRFSEVVTIANLRVLQEKLAWSSAIGGTGKNCADLWKVGYWDGTGLWDDATFTDLKTVTGYSEDNTVILDAPVEAKAIALTALSSAYTGPDASFFWALYAIDLFGAA